LPPPRGADRRTLSSPCEFHAPKHKPSVATRALRRSAAERRIVSCSVDMTFITQADSPVVAIDLIQRTLQRQARKSRQQVLGALVHEVLPQIGRSDEVVHRCHLCV
jgi:hypothetical protein